MSNGGARPGAGRKKGSVTKKTQEKRIEEALAREHLVKRYLEKWNELAQTALNLALGEIQVINFKGKFINVYKLPPDSRQLQSVIETVIGKPKQELAGSIDLPQLNQLANDIRKILDKK